MSSFQEYHSPANYQDRLGAIGLPLDQSSTVGNTISFYLVEFVVGNSAGISSGPILFRPSISLRMVDHSIKTGIATYLVITLVNLFMNKHNKHC